MSELKRDEQIQSVEDERTALQEAINRLLPDIKSIPIAGPDLMPYGWRKAAKGRTVWRIVEEVISQNLEKHAEKLGFAMIEPASSEVGIYDFKFQFKDREPAFVNIKSAVQGVKRSKDDISKAEKVLNHYRDDGLSNLYIATFILDFTDEPSVKIRDSVVMPLAWIPDVYVNPSNNGNIQSSHAKHLEMAEKRTNEEFIDVLTAATRVAEEKKRAGRR